MDEFQLTNRQFVYNDHMEIPLFPLNTVLFPGWPMPLHIFEPRYLEMVRFCTEEKSPFGILLIKQGKAEGDLAVVPHDVGCMVEITQMERLEDGRLLIMAVGQERFRVLSLNRNRAYLVGQVEQMPYLPEKTAPLQEAANELHPLVLDYLTQLTTLADNIEFDPTQVPTEPESLSHMAASLLQVSLETKQSLLEARKVSNVLTFLTGQYRREIDILKQFPRQEMGNFSVN
ncbi:MAG: LON peptidase substrate-binding domain-containing protein [Ardenticatenaceae bacterium]|nr:LON peptidase substrate-binding domain-containing protein [Ardenticatenaceae bacterium]